MLERLVPRVIEEGVSLQSREIKLSDRYTILFKVKNGLYMPWIKNGSEEFPIDRSSAAGLMALKLLELSK